MLLEKINSVADLKKLSTNDLDALASEIREYILEVISTNGGHLASSLGVVELTIALHYVFNTPRDKIIWDVGHQCYAHKILTGRREEFRDIRCFGGIAGFPKMRESAFDAFDTGHSSTSLSLACGAALGRDLTHKKQQGHRRYRRRVADRRHGVRGDQPDRPYGERSHHHPERQRTFNQPERGRHVPVPHPDHFELHL